MSKAKTALAQGNFKELLGGDVRPKIQKVHPAQESKATTQEIEQTQLMVWIPTDLMVRLKTKTVIERKSMKEIVTELLEKNI